MHKKTAPSFVHYGEPEKIEKSFAFNVDIFSEKRKTKKELTRAYVCVILFECVEAHNKQAEYPLSPYSTSS